MKVRHNRKRIQEVIKHHKRYLWIWNEISRMHGVCVGLHQAVSEVERLGELVKNVEWSKFGVQQPSSDYIREMKRGHDEYLRNLTRSA